jgi:hypothetical protein
MIISVDGCWNDITDNGGGYPGVADGRYAIDSYIVEFKGASADCTDRNGGAGGDPHFKTWAGDWYDFMGACDLHLLQAPKFDEGMDLTVDVRTRIRYEYSYIESAAIRIGDEILEVSSWGEYHLNGIDSAEMPNHISGYLITHSEPTEKSHVFEISIDGNERIKVKTFKDMVSIEFNHADLSRFKGSAGMMGDFESGKLLSRDRSTVIEDPVALADEWQVLGDERNLFQTAQAPQYPEKCVMPSPSKQKRGRRLGESIARATAEKVCAKYTNGDQELEACVYDVMATGDLDLAQAGAF